MLIWYSRNALWQPCFSPRTLKKRCRDENKTSQGTTLELKASRWGTMGIPVKNLIKKKIEAPVKEESSQKKEVRNVFIMRVCVLLLLWSFLYECALCFSVFVRILVNFDTRKWAIIDKNTTKLEMHQSAIFSICVHCVSVFLFVFWWILIQEN